MKQLITALSFSVFFGATAAFSQSEKPQFFMNSLASTAAKSNIVSPQNTLTKRPSGESTSQWSVIAIDTDSADSTQYFYNNNNNLASERRYRIVENGAWILKFRTMFLSYDSLGNSLQEIFQSTQDNGATWKNASRYTLAYNAAGKNTYLAVEYWNSSANVWYAPSITTYEYDAHGNITGSYSNSFKIQYANAYNADGFLSSVIYMYSDETFIWDTTTQLTYEYDTIHPGLPILLSSLEYQPIDGSWIPNDWATYTYDNAGNMIQSDYYEGEIISTQWGCKRIHRSVQSFDAQNQLIKGEYFEVCQDDTTQNWQKTYNINYGYDADGDPTFLMETGYYGADTTFIFRRYTYETVSRVQQPLSLLEFSFYPNPTPGTILLQTTMEGPLETKIYDMQGRLLFAQEVEADKKCNLTGMPNGQYILQVTGKDGKVAARPIVIAR